MRVLFVTYDNSGASLCYKLHKEGNDVRLLIFDKNKLTQKALSGMVKKISDLKKGLSWVGKNGLVVFDNTGYGKLQNKLRKEGYSVVGGSELGDKLEDNRQYGQKIFSAVGMKIVPSVNFPNLHKTIDFLKKNPGPWVIKQNGHANKTINYVGKFKDNRDTISLLNRYNRSYYTKKNCTHFDLQERIDGVEIGVGRYFNGQDWVGPIEINIEYKDFFGNNLGPKTHEMGTLMWYDDNVNNKLLQETLAKLKSYLQKIDFRGDIDINCIVNKKGAFPLEATARFGYPAVQLHMEIHKSPWGEFLKALADGKGYDLKWKKGYGIVVLVATPPFPYHRPQFASFSPEGITIFFKDSFTQEDLNHIHFEEIAKRKTGEYYICDHTGYVMHVTGMGKTVEEARRNVYSIVNKIVIPKKYYRTDIGEKFIREDYKKLKRWGYI